MCLVKPEIKLKSPLELLNHLIDFMKLGSGGGGGGLMPLHCHRRHNFDLVASTISKMAYVET
jgi:hypothetical protein